VISHGWIKGDQLALLVHPPPHDTLHPPVLALAAHRSTQVDDPVNSYAVGVIKGHQLVLVPLDFTLQLRPNMAYLNPSE
jgi:hypothetical protein